MPQQHEIEYLNFKQKVWVNLGLQSWHFFVPLCIQVQPPMAGSGTEEDIFRKASREHEAIKGYCHVVGEYFHAFLNLLSVLSISDHCAVLMAKKLDSNSVTDVYNSGEWISIPACLIVVLTSCWEGFELNFLREWKLSPSHLNWFNSTASKRFPESEERDCRHQESTWRSSQRNPSHSSQKSVSPEAQLKCLYTYISHYFKRFLNMWGLSQAVDNKETK